jgi:hypothetical protein
VTPLAVSRRFDAKRRLCPHRHVLDRYEIDRQCLRTVDSEEIDLPAVIAA